MSRVSLHLTKYLGQNYNQLLIGIEATLKRNNTGIRMGHNMLTGKG